MIKERILLNGDSKSKVKQLMEYAGWYESRSVDISIAEQYYSDRGVEMMKTTNGSTVNISACAVSGTSLGAGCSELPTLDLGCSPISSMELKIIWRMTIYGICLGVNWNKSNR